MFLVESVPYNEQNVNILQLQSAKGLSIYKSVLRCLFDVSLKLFAYMYNLYNKSWQPKKAPEETAYNLLSALSSRLRNIFRSPFLRMNIGFQAVFCRMSSELIVRSWSSRKKYQTSRVICWTDAGVELLILRTSINMCKFPMKLNNVVNDKQSIMNVVNKLAVNYR